jgi:hypothetical protein
MTPAAQRIAFAIGRVKAAHFPAARRAMATQIEIAATEMVMDGETITIMVAALIEVATEAS